MVSGRATINVMPARGGTMLVGGEALTGMGAAKRLDSSLEDVCRIAEWVGGSYTTRKKHISGAPHFAISGAPWVRHYYHATNNKY